MTHPCKACEREKRPTINVALYNADGKFFCEEHKPEAIAICRKVSRERSIKWSVSFRREGFV